VAEVELDCGDGVAVITIDRPGSRNAMALSTSELLSDALDTAEQSSAQVVVLRGAGDRAFVSGGDLRELSAIRDVSAAVDMATRVRRLLDRISTCPLPVIAALNGHALGGGAEVAVAADIRIAADDISLGFSQSHLGIMPAWGGAERLVEIVGRSQALLLIASGRALSAVEAESIGLVDLVVSRSDFDQYWRTTADAFARLPAGGARKIKAVVAAAKPYHHPALETEAVRLFASMWADETHWRMADEFDQRRRRGGAKGARQPDS
jgi:enoyl-CoA hydratase/carnithine racemase